MHCRSCGYGPLDPNDPCPRCGWREGEPVRGRGLLVARCPSCGFRGQGVPYFRRASHVFLLIGAAVFTYGIGGLVYWLVKRNARICPNCGLDWERASLAPTGYRPGPEGDGGAGEPELPSGGEGRRVLGVTTLLVAILLVLLGLVEGAGGAALLPVGGALAGAGAVTFWWGWSSMQARREELMRRLQTRVLRLAARKRSSLTASEVAHELDLSLTAAERILISMEDGFRVRSEVTDEGLLVFEFPELASRRELPPTDPAGPRRAPPDDG